MKLFTMINFSKIRTTFSKGVTLPSLTFILGICIVAASFPLLTESALNIVKSFIFVNLNWMYIWAVTIFVIFLVYLMFSKYGNIKLGSNDSKPEYSFFSWVSMLFAAGMGIGLMYFSVAEPMQHYSDTIFQQDTPMNRAKNAQLYTFFHWGIHAWAIYGMVGLSLAYFAHRYRLPLALRSGFYPLLKDKISGRWGNAIDVFALCSTFFGITTTLGFGVVQIASGLETLGIIADNNFDSQLIIIITLVSLSILSAVSGVDKGVRILSNVNVVSVILLMLTVLALGPTVYLIGSFTEGLGSYFNNFFNLTFGTHVYDQESLPWFYNWTILYWAWWISWSPYVGIFIAKISKGRTIREFIAAVLILPTLFNFIWMSIFGNSAIWFDQHVANGALSSLATNPDALMFRFFEYLPMSTIFNYVTILIIIIFFVTSADSGIFVMNSIATKNAKISPRWQIIFWGTLLATLALLLLNAGGLAALQSMTLITALPFSIIILLFIVCLLKALTVDSSYYEKDFSVSTITWSGESWKQRLKQIVSFKDSKSVDGFINSTVESAFNDLQAEFESNGIVAKINRYEDPLRIEIEIHHDVVNNFVYGVKNYTREISNYLLTESNLPDVCEEENHYPKSYFGDAREGYDVQLFTKNELISDVLKHYERFIDIIVEEGNEIFISINANRRLK